MLRERRGSFIAEQQFPMPKGKAKESMPIPDPAAEPELPAIDEQLEWLAGRDAKDDEIAF